MGPSVKLAVISTMGEEASLQGISACLSLSPLHSSRTTAISPYYLMSTSSYKHSIKVFYSSCVSDSNSVYKNHVRQNGG